MEIQGTLQMCEAPMAGSGVGVAGWGWGSLSELSMESLVIYLLNPSSALALPKDFELLFRNAVVLSVYWVSP